MRGLGAMTGGGRTRWRPLLFLASLPLALLLFNDAWIWDSTAFFDNHVYVGFFRHYLDFNYPFVENYKSSRLPFVLPGVLLYRILPDATAHHALFLLFLIGGSALLFLWGRQRFGPHAAFVAAAFHAVFTFSHTGPSYHNVPACAYFMAALVLLDSPARWPSWARVALAGAAFTCSVTTNSVAAALTPVFGLHAWVAVPRPRTLAAIAGHALASLAGAALALVSLGAVNAALGGPFVFFMGQVQASMFLVQSQSLSSVPLSGFASVWRFPWLVLPFFTGLASAALLVARGAQRRFDACALAAFAFLISMVMAAAMHERGLGVLEFPHLFHPFFAPMFLALPALLRACLQRREAEVGPLAPRFLVASWLLLLVPLSLLGALIHRTILFTGRSWPELESGSLLAFPILAAAAPLAAWKRRSPAGLTLVAAGTLGLVNPVHTQRSQPASLYDITSRCSFRRDFFSALVEADPAFSAFDPTNQAHWVYPCVPFDEPQFDGRGWCSRLPVETVARDILLTHYFYTSAQFTNGFRMPPLRKLVVSARDAAGADFVLRWFQRRFPSDLRYAPRFSLVITRPTFSVHLRGYDVLRADQARSEK